MLCSGCCGDGCGDSMLSGFVGDFAGLTYWAHLKDGWRFMGLSSCCHSMMKITWSIYGKKDLRVPNRLGNHPGILAGSRSGVCSPLLNFEFVGLHMLVVSWSIVEIGQLTLVLDDAI